MDTLKWKKTYAICEREANEKMVEESLRELGVTSPAVVKAAYEEIKASAKVNEFCLLNHYKEAKPEPDSIAVAVWTAIGYAAFGTLAALPYWVLRDVKRSREISIAVAVGCVLLFGVARSIVTRWGVTHLNSWKGFGAYLWDVVSIFLLVGGTAVASAFITRAIHPTTNG